MLMSGSMVGFSSDRVKRRPYRFHALGEFTLICLSLSNQGSVSNWKQVMIALDQLLS